MLLTLRSRRPSFSAQLTLFVSEMSTDTVISLLLGIPLSIITGLYSGAILSRYVRFSELRNEVLRIIRKIDFTQEQHGLSISKNDDVAKLILISSDLYFLKHRKAAETVNSIRAEIDEISMNASIGRLKVGAFEQNYSNWQHMARTLPPNKLVLWSLWAKL